MAKRVWSVAMAFVLFCSRWPRRSARRKPNRSARRICAPICFFLAGDSLRGRLTDTNENRAAADYIRSRFERVGLEPRRRTDRTSRRTT